MLIINSARNGFKRKPSHPNIKIKTLAHRGTTPTKNSAFESGGAWRSEEIRSMAMSSPIHGLVQQVSLIIFVMLLTIENHKSNDTSPKQQERKNHFTAFGTNFNSCAYEAKPLDAYRDVPHKTGGASGSAETRGRSEALICVYIYIYVHICIYKYVFI